MSLLEDKKPEVITMLLEGKTITYIAKTLDLSKNTVSRIKDD